MPQVIIFNSNIKCALLVAIKSTHLPHSHTHDIYNHNHTIATTTFYVQGISTTNIHNLLSIYFKEINFY